MRSRIRCAFIPLLLLSSLTSPAKASEPLLWEVTHDQSVVSLYLFGALHFGAESFYPLPERVLDAYRRADILAVELDTEKISSTVSQQVLIRLGQYSGDQILSKAIDPDLWRRLSDNGKALGLKPQEMLRLKPWLAALQLVNLQVSRSDYQARLGLDTYFLRLAHADDQKHVHALETLEEQLALFAGLTEGQQRDFLEHTLETVEAGEAQLASLAKAWQSSDISALERATLGAFTDEEFSRRLYHRVFQRRNQAMVQKVADYINEGKRVFLVVGIGHLLGDEGLVAMLTDQGYRVTRLD